MHHGEARQSYMPRFVRERERERKINRWREREREREGQPKIVSMAVLMVLPKFRTSLKNLLMLDRTFEPERSFFAGSGSGKTSTLT